MLSLRRRKPLQRQTGALNSLTDLPDDVLILVYSQCRIDELFTLRLASTKTRNLIDEYITTIAPSVARSTLPLSDHLLARLMKTGSPFNFRLLKAVVPE